MSVAARAQLVLMIGSSAGCSLSPFVPLEGAVDSGVINSDAGRNADAAPNLDALPSLDAGSDARPNEDAETGDGRPDATVPADSGEPDAFNADAMTLDALAPGNGRVRVRLAGPGSGSVTSDHGSLDCPMASCEADFNPATPVVLTAAADLGSRFAGWTGCTPNGTSCSVTVTSGLITTATVSFALFDTPIEVRWSTGGTFRIGATTCSTSPCFVSRPYGTQVVIDPVPASGFGFGQFGAAPCQYVDCAFRLAPPAPTATVTVDGSFVSALVASYAFEGNGSDASRHGHNAMAPAGVTYTGGHIGQAATLSGNDRFVVNDNAELYGQGALTICARVHPTGGAADQVIVRKGQGYSLSIHRGGGDQVSFHAAAGCVVGSPCAADASATGTFSAGFSLVCGVFESGATGRVQAYFDSAPGAAVGSLLTGALINTPGDGLTLGGCAGCGTELTGDLDEVRIWNAALSASDIQAEFNRR